MNLIKDAWLPVIRAKSGKGLIAPWQIAEQDDPVMELAAPRSDFQGAMYQFLIGLLQTGFAPEDLDEWLDFWEAPPPVESLRTRLEALAGAFEFDHSGPAFMQDFSLTDGEPKGIASLLIEAPGGKTVRENLDHFVKRDRAKSICKTCAAMALFTLQINAPSGGVGHRVGLRGGGPLTTLVLPPDTTTLWRKLWLNVLDKTDLPKYPINSPARVFPWMAPTRVSDKSGTDTTPENTHPLQAYWGMPRRIRIVFSAEPVLGDCSLCNGCGVELIEGFRTRNYGVNYMGAWVHPLTPYRFDPKKEKPPLSLKGQQGGLGYRHWLGLTLADDEDGDRAALVVRRYSEQRACELRIQRTARLWCFGYDMDNMKARCWYDHTFPLFNIEPIQRKRLLLWTGELVAAAQDAGSILRKQVKAAWFRRPEDAKGDMNTVVTDFWQRSEPIFYGLLDQLSVAAGKSDNPPPELYSRWRNTLLKLSLQLFDRWVLEAPLEDMDMKRIIGERDGLLRQVGGCKSMKILKTRSITEKEGADGAKG
ncbi:type I-E CRISPR-associated protein Cse1/CasA [Geoalkalibacter halelectricus]|uniref:type I-E CRISPR-associated protein Cse1/CasA n=1 Tax=Geoalkalibacter halelectricus TaxID=2847045 RepID=UPI003D244916